MCTFFYVCPLNIAFRTCASFFHKLVMKIETKLETNSSNAFNKIALRELEKAKAKIIYFSVCLNYNKHLYHTNTLKISYRPQSHRIRDWLVIP